jgi:hypothetical protein
MRIVIQACPGIKQGPISKITKTKRAGSIAQVIEFLPSKHKAQSSNASITEEKKIEEMLNYLTNALKINLLAIGEKSYTPVSYYYTNTNKRWIND